MKKYLNKKNKFNNTWFKFKENWCSKIEIMKPNLSTAFISLVGENLCYTSSHRWNFKLHVFLLATICVFLLVTILATCLSIGEILCYTCIYISSHSWKFMLHVFMLVTVCVTSVLLGKNPSYKCLHWWKSMLCVFLLVNICAAWHQVDKNVCYMLTSWWKSATCLSIDENMLHVFRLVKICYMSSDWWKYATCLPIGENLLHVFQLVKIHATCVLGSNSSTNIIIP